MKNFRNSAYASLLNRENSSSGIREFYVRSAGYCRADKNYQENPRNIDFGEFFWCESGRGIFFYKDKRFVLNPGEVWFFPPGSRMHFRPAEEGFSFYWLTFYGEIFMPLCRELNIRAGKKKCGMPPDELFQQLISAVRFSTPDRRIEILNIALPILLKIASPRENESVPRTLSVAAKAKQMIEKNFANHHFNINFICGQLGIHRVTLCREFKKAYKITPSDFIISCRLHKAVELLETRQYLVKEVANMCGFTSPEYFATLCISRLGQSPSHFLQLENLKNSPEI